MKRAWISSHPRGPAGRIPGSIEETILTEILANALDSGARTLELRTDRIERTLVACDDGSGMTRRELTRYHDLAASSKKRGHGIGFAGVGIKLGLLACDEVITETRRGSVHAATTWKLSSRARAPWSWIDPPHLLEGNGTAVLLRLANPLSTLLDAAFLEAMALRNFQPLFEPEFIDILASSYPAGFSISIDDRVVVGPIRPGVPLRAGHPCGAAAEALRNRLSVAARGAAARARAGSGNQHAGQGDPARLGLS